MMFFAVAIFIFGNMPLSGSSLQVSESCTSGVHCGDNDVFRTSNLEVKASARSLRLSIDGNLVFEFPIGVAVDTDESLDNDLFEPSFIKKGNHCTWTVQSSNWEKKEYLLSVEGDAVVLRVKVQGQGKLTKLRYFPENKNSGQKPGYEVSRYLVPVALGGAKALPQWRNTMENGIIELGYMTPPLLAFPFQGNFNGSCVVGLAPQPGKYNIDHFRCEFAMFQDGLFTTDFYGYTEVDGEYELPALIFTGGGDEFKALASYSDWLYQYGGCRKIDRSEIPRWWLGPFFCGWGEQGYLSPGNIFAGANQKDYTIMSDRLDSLGLKPTVIIIDDKWQSKYGEMLPDSAKWPDLRKFVDSEHAKGRRVLLWMKTWDNEGLRSEECIKNLTTPHGADPTSPKYRDRIRKTVYRLLSPDPGCFNCDGFKIDFANCMPLGRNLKTHEKGVYGIELLKRMMALIYESAKTIKPDCLINTSCAHPYFADVTDQCRLHDYNSQLRYLWEVREHRAKLFQAAFPGISIDTDDEACSSRQQVINYLHRAPELGVPVLYHLHGSENLPLTDDDFRWIAKIWNDYSQKIKDEE